MINSNVEEENNHFRDNKMKNKDLKIPDKYTLGMRKKHPLLKFIGKSLIKGIGFLVGIFLLFVLTAFVLLNDIAMALVSIPLILLVIAFKIKNFRSYYQKTYPNRDFKVKSADKSSLYTNGIPHDISNSYSQLSTNNYFIAETYIHKLVQVIKGKNSFYIHYLKIKDDGTGFIEESLITDFNNIDSCKKYNSKDYRINFSSVKKIEYSDKSAENTVLKNNGIIMLDTGEKKKYNNRYFYPVSEISDTFIRKFFKSVKKIIYFNGESKKRVPYSEAFKKLGKTRIAYILLNTMYYISTILSICIPVYEIQSLFAIVSIIIPVTVLIIYFLNSSEFTMDDYHKGDESNEFLAITPNIPKSLILPLFVNLIFVFVTDMTEYFRYIMISLVISAVISLILLLVSGSKKAFLPSIMIAAALSFSAVSTINYRFDFSEPYVYDTVIIDKRSYSGYKGGRSYYIDVELKNKESAQLKVSYEEYNNCDISDTIEIYEYGGFLKIPYVEAKFY